MDEVNRLRLSEMIRTNKIRHFISSLGKEYYDKNKNDLRMALLTTKPILFTDQDAYNMISGN